jgi:ABC-type transporter Mla subunit MlaD
MYGGVRNYAPQLQRFLKSLAVRRAALEQQREDIEAVLGEIAMLEKQCHDLLGDDAVGAAAAKAELAKRIRSAA